MYQLGDRLVPLYMQLFVTTQDERLRITNIYEFQLIYIFIFIPNKYIFNWGWINFGRIGEGRIDVGSDRHESLQ